MATENPWKRINDQLSAICEKKGCSNCVHRKDFLVPCDWLKTQTRVIVNCPRFEKEKE